MLNNRQAAKQNRFAFTVSSKDGNNENIFQTIVNGLYFHKNSSHNLPPKGHIRYQQHPLSSCVSCHAGLVDVKGNIIEKTKDRIGKVNDRGN